MGLIVSPGLHLTRRRGLRVSHAAAPPGPPPLDPTVYACTAWWTSNVGLGLVGGDVDTWTDRVASRVLTAVVRPTVGTPVNGHAIVQTDGSSQYMASSGGTDPLSTIVTSTAASVVAVVSFDTITAPGSYAGFANANHLFGDSNEYLTLGADTNGGGHNAIFALYDGAYHVCRVPVTPGNLIVVSARFGGGTMRLSVNGGADVTASSGAIAALSAAMRMGRGSSVYGDLRVGEVVVFDRDITGADNTALVADTMAAYGIV